MDIVMLKIIIVLGILIVLFLSINHLYMKSNSYMNTYRMHSDFKIDQNSQKQLLVFGSTYARYAFDSIRTLQINGANLSLKSQSLHNDYINFKKYQSCIAPNGIAIFVLAPCTLLYKGTKRKTCLMQKLIPGNAEASFKQALDYYFPLLLHPQRIIKIFNGVKSYDIYDGQPTTISEQNSEISMEQLVSIWTKLFSMKNLTDDNISDENMEVINVNTKILEKIMEHCKEKDVNAVILIPPFSKKLNRYFSNAFIQKVLTDNILALHNKYPNVIILDYRLDDFFQEKLGLFIDGGFLLNRRGSQLLIRKLGNDLKKYGIEFSNETVGI